MAVTSKHFPESDFRAAVPKCSLQDMKQSTIDKFDKARALYGKPMRVNSAYRSPKWEKSKGRSGTGAHTLGQALDISCTTDDNRFAIVMALLMAGFTRIGIAKTYIHADDSAKHKQDIIWLY